MWNLYPSERLRSWQLFRHHLDALELEQAIKECNHLWAFCPYQSHYLHIDFADHWPNPWELLHENIYCDLARALGIMYTLYLTDHKIPLEIRVYNDSTAKTQYNLVWINQGKYVLNYLHDEIVNKTQIDQQLKLVKKITIQDLKLDKIK